jgi:hypothetical protein
MALELVYTSAERGLRPGTSGFCTVAMTRGLPPALVPRLEALGGYRPGPTGDGPVAFSFWRVETAAGIAHVLSVVGPAPPDHTARTNKIAAYAVLGPEELSAAGPAWMIAQGGFLRRSWNGAPAWIESPVRAPSAADPGPAACSAWKAACGDAGWAGAVASTFLRDQSKPIHVVYAAGTDPLPLVDEVIRLLPDWARWRATFSTYFLQPVAGTPCALRFCLEGTPAADAARQSKGLVLDLTRPMGEAPDSRHVRMARTGRDAEAVAARPAPAKPKSAAAAAAAPRAIELEPLDAPASARQSVHPLGPMDRTEDFLPADDSSPRPWMYAAVAAGVTLLVLLVASIIIAVQSSDSPPPQATPGGADAAAAAEGAGPPPARKAPPAAFGEAAPTEAFEIEGASGPKPAAVEVPQAGPAPGQAPPPARGAAQGDAAAGDAAPDAADGTQSSGTGTVALPARVPTAAPKGAPPPAAGDAPVAEPASVSSPEPTSAPVAVPSVPSSVIAMRASGGVIALRSDALAMPKGAVGVRLVPSASLAAAGACTSVGESLAFGSSDLRATVATEGSSRFVHGIAKDVPGALAAALGAGTPTPEQALRAALDRCALEYVDAGGTPVGRAQFRVPVTSAITVGAGSVRVAAPEGGSLTVALWGPEGNPTARRVAVGERVEIAGAGAPLFVADRTVEQGAMLVSAKAVAGDASRRVAEVSSELTALDSLVRACKALRSPRAESSRTRDVDIATVQEALTDEERAALKLAPKADGLAQTVELGALRPLLPSIELRAQERIDRLLPELPAGPAGGRQSARAPASWRLRAFDADGVMLLDSVARPAKGGAR